MFHPLASCRGNTGAGLLRMQLLEMICLVADGLGKFFGRFELTKQRHVLESVRLNFKELFSESGQIRFGYDDPIIQYNSIQ